MPVYFPWVPPEFDPDLAEASGWEGCSAGPHWDTHQVSPALSPRLRNGVKYCKVLRLPEVSGAAPAPLPTRDCGGMRQRLTPPRL